ncbi:MAG: pitrilysin family protein [bacterium]|nr:pitrilysin family protein [bacterium]
MFTSFHLKNGARVIIAPRKDTQAVTVMVFVKVGSRYEAVPLNGASHFLEHLMFKGTKRRPDTLTISKELDSIGAEFNAFTSKDHTAYYIKASKQHLDLALDMLSDMLINSKFDAKELDRERGVIIEEINMYEDNPMALVEDVFEKQLYGGTPLGRNIAGTKQGIAAMNRKAMLQYKDAYYVGSNTTIIVSGSVPKNVRPLITSYFQKYPSTRVGKRFVAQTGFAKPGVVLRQKATEQVHLTIGMPTFGYLDKRNDALALLSIILGGTMSSRLFIEIRERRGLCYYIRASVNPYEQVGHFAIQAGIDKQRIDQAIPAITAELAKVVRSGVTAEELHRAKEYVKGKFILSLEDSENVAGWLGKQALFQRQVKTDAERIVDFEKVTRRSVEQVARQVLRPSAFRLAIVGPYTDQARFARLLRG